jgi:hypothetical protein
MLAPTTNGRLGLSKLSEQMQLGVAEDQARQICADAVAQLGWRNEQEGGALVAKPGMGMTKWPSKLTVTVAAAGDGASSVNIDGSILGAGPVQKKHLRKDIADFRSAVEQRAAAG